MEQEKKHWIIREAVESDIPFIYSTWTNSYRYDSALGKLCRNNLFFVQYNKVIDRILSLKDTIVDVAALPGDPNVILGYMVSQPGILHYVFVKESFQGFGIAKDLWNAAELPASTTITHRTRCVEPFLDQHPKIIYNPFLLFKQGAEENG